MARRRTHRAVTVGLLALLTGVGVGVGVTRAAGPPEIPSLVERVAKGELPPVAQRLPERPLVVSTEPEAAHGGDLRMLIGTPKDWKLAFVYGYARLIRYDRNYNLVPDIAERVEVTDGDRSFTFHLRKGHRWSDGHPFTSADFRYWWEHVANEEALTPGGPPSLLIVDGEPPTVTFPDALTVRYRWSKPNNNFLPDQAGASPTILYRPAHYLKQFHKAFTDPAKLRQMARAERRSNWAALHNKRDALYVMDNPEQPTLQPWRPTAAPPADILYCERNPFFHRVDQQGRQLPYVDRLVMVHADRSLIPVKASTGEADLQARYLSFDQATYLKRNEASVGYRVHLWSTAAAAAVALYPNLTTTDQVMRELLRDRRFRRALSLAINRDEINKVFFYGLGAVGQNIALRSPAVQENQRLAYARFDLAQASRLLDDMGLTRRDAKGFRLRADGQRLDILVETAGESTEQTDILELVGDTWSQIGIELISRPSQREVFRRRIMSGEAVMSISNSDLFGIVTPDMSPYWLTPVAAEHLQWSAWGDFYESKGKHGEKPPAGPQRLVDLYQHWMRSTDRAERARVWGEILDIHADEVYVLGIIGGTLQPVLVRNGLRGVPAEGIFAWEPGSHFGIYSPDTFYWMGGKRPLVGKAAR